MTRKNDFLQQLEHRLLLKESPSHLDNKPLSQRISQEELDAEIKRLEAEVEVGREATSRRRRVFPRSRTRRPYWR
jgi:hypothetical protein